LGSPNSISRVRLSDLDRLQDGSRINLTFYKESRDLDSAALYGGMQSEGGVTPNGDVWFASNRGAVHIAANKIVPPTPSPVIIDEIAVDGQPIALDREVVLKPDNGRMEISYAVIHLGSQEGFRYRYVMEGFESWNEVSTRRTAYYTHLPPGKYRFRVQVYEIGNPGIVSEASIIVVQKPHFYATISFLVICIAASLLAVFLVYRLRLRQMKMRFQAVSEERARLAREMHDTVIQGCVGVSALLEAALEVEPAEEPLREQLLNYATDQVRETIETAREAVWDLRNRSKSAANAGTLCEQLARQVQTDSGVPIRCRIMGEPFELGESATHELLMTVREALANAVAHADPKDIHVNVSFTRHDLKIEIQDDGRGFDRFALAPQDGHYGIVGMQERMQILRGSMDIESHPGRGTTVRMSIPRKQNENKGIVTRNADEELHKD
jgi:signal transduction histidine kinase